MNRRTVAIVGAILSVATALLAERSSPLGARKLNDAFLAAIKTGDLKAIMNLYAPGAVLFPPGERPDEGVSAIRFRWERLLKKNRVVDATISDADYRTAGDLSAGWGHLSINLEPRDGSPPLVLKARFCVVAERALGKWRYVEVMVADMSEPLTLKHYSAK